LGKESMVKEKVMKTRRERERFLTDFVKDLHCTKLFTSNTFISPNKTKQNKTKQNKTKKHKRRKYKNW